MDYRKETYIAADWSSDINAIAQLKKWNDNQRLSLSFTNAHELTQAKNSSSNCSIKSLLETKLDNSKTFILIVGSNTKTVKFGSCKDCDNYKRWSICCAGGSKTRDYRSYIECVCEKAIKDGLKIVVLYNATNVDKSKCPDAVRNIGTHIAMQQYKHWNYYWDYQSVIDAIY